MIILGCDPGQSGGLGLIGEYPNHVLSYKMPETITDLITLLKSFGRVDHCYLERVHSSPQMGVTSAFKFGYNYGTLEACIICAGIPVTKVTPQVWQKAMNCRSGGDKNVTKRRAQELFPNVTVTHAISDALLIGEYGRRIETNRA